MAASVQLSPSLGVTLLFFQLFQWTTVFSECDTEERVRKPWHWVSEEDKLLYVNGFQTLHRESMLIEFLESHQKATTGDTYNIHDEPENFFWHSYWLWEMENSFRALGGDYECFTLPYWDPTHDADAWDDMDFPKEINLLPIYSSHLGGDGEETNSYCVAEPWNKKNYITDALCADDEIPMQCCLKRNHPTNTALPERKDFSDAIFVNKSYIEYQEFITAVNDLHATVHNFVGTDDTHFAVSGGYQAFDPLFPLFHSFIEYVRLLRTDCYQFDLVATEDLDDFIPYAFDNAYGRNVTLNYPMDFSALCDGSNGENKRLCSDHDITPRLMYDVSPNTPFNLVYELGDFWSSNDELNSRCKDYINSSWWLNSMEADHQSESISAFTAVHWFSNVTMSTSLSVILLTVIAVSMLILLRVRVRGKMAKAMNGRGERGEYITIV